MHRYRFNLILTHELLVKITMKPALGPYQLDKLQKIFTYLSWLPSLAHA